MRKTPSKDVSAQNGHQRATTAQTDEQKAFEMEVQELIRQAKQQLKASSPFRDEENAASAEVAPTPVPETPAPEPQPVVSFPTEPAPLEAESPVSSSPEMQTSKEDTQRAEQLALDLQEAHRTISELQAELARKEEARQVKPQERQPVYGHAAAQPSTETITRDDLKLEFLNFTSAHIDQFNTRIKKTEDIVASLAQHQPRAAAVQPAKPGWMQWLNTFLLGICTLLLLGLFFDNPKEATSEDKTVAAPTPAASAPVTKKETPAETPPASPGNKDTAPTSASAAPTNTLPTAKVAAAPPSAPAATPVTVPPGKPAAVPVAKTPGTPPAKPVAANPAPQPKPIATAAVPQAKPATTPAPQPKQNMASATKPATKSIPAPAPSRSQTAAKSNATTQRNLSLQDALRPVTDEELSRERNARRAAKNQAAAEPKTALRKPVKSNEAVSFGDD